MPYSHEMDALDGFRAFSGNLRRFFPHVEETRKPVQPVQPVSDTNISRSPAPPETIVARGEQSTDSVQRTAGQGDAPVVTGGIACLMSTCSIAHDAQFVKGVEVA